MFFTYFFSTGPTLRCSLQVFVPHSRNKRCKNYNLFSSFTNFYSSFLMDWIFLTEVLQLLWNHLEYKRLVLVKQFEALIQRDVRVNLKMNPINSGATANIETAQPVWKQQPDTVGMETQGFELFVKGIIPVRSFSPFLEKTLTLFLRKVLWS